MHMAANHTYASADAVKGSLLTEVSAVHEL